MDENKLDNPAFRGAAALVAEAFLHGAYNDLAESTALHYLTALVEGGRLHCSNASLEEVMEALLNASGHPEANTLICQEIVKLIRERKNEEDL